jgi:hypothetical protein
VTRRAPIRRRRRRHRPRLLWAAALAGAGVALLLIVVALIAVVHGVSLEHRLRTLPATLRAVTSDAEEGHLGAAQAELARAQVTLTSVNSSLYNSPDFEIMNVLPIARQNLRAIRSGVRLGLQMVGGAEDILNAASPLEQNGQLSVPLEQGQIPLKTVEAVQAAVQDVASTLPDAPTSANGSFVLAPVRTAVDKVFREGSNRQAELQSVGAALRVVEDMAGAAGDRRYLIAVGNSAEMRGSGGMILSYGVLASHAGKVTLVHLGPIDELKLSSPETSASFPADFMSTYSGLAPTSDWRDANMMSDFTVVAPVLEGMFEHATGLHVDGVIQVDSAGLAALLSGVGPVSTPDLGTVSYANAVSVTLNTAYELFPNRTVRQDYTGEVAQAAFQQLTSGKFTTLKPLGTALIEASKQRHVLMYADDPTDETAVRHLGFDGALPPSSSDFAQLTIQNFGANKLDYYLASSLRLSGRHPSEIGSLMTATIDLANTAPSGQTIPQEVFGPFSPAQNAGEYDGLVTLYLPTGSYLRASSADHAVTTPPVMGSQNGLRTVSFTVTIPAGGTSHVVLQLFIPPTPSPRAQFGFVPSPRVISTRFKSDLS